MFECIAAISLTLLRCTHAEFPGPRYFNTYEPTATIRLKVHFSCGYVSNIY